MNANFKVYTVYLRVSKEIKLTNGAETAVEKTKRIEKNGKSNNNDRRCYDCDGYGPISRTNRTSVAFKTNKLYVNRGVTGVIKCRKSEKRRKKRNIFRKTFSFETFENQPAAAAAKVRDWTR